MPKQRYRDNQGNEIVLGHHIASGGEGAVFEVVGRPELVAKIYKDSVPREKSEKLCGMASIGTPELLKFAAWPRATLSDWKNGAVKGLVMPHIKGARPIHQLYSPTDRKLHFPRADWRFLIRTARNCAAAFATLHNHRIVIGDVNQGNAFVSSDALVTLIDCDSFQIAVHGRVHRCHVGIPHFTPPELHSVKSFDGVDRTPNHDSFGLAILIFHLLFVGRHPFAGSYRGQGDMPIEQAIQRGLFAYSDTAALHQMFPPPCVPTLRDISPEVADLFKRAFLSRTRPTAEEWANALARLESRVCKCNDDPGHFYLAEFSSCPWCRILGSSGTNYFISATLAALAGQDASINIAILWEEIQRLPPPSASIGSITLPFIEVEPEPLPNSLFAPICSKLLEELALERQMWEEISREAALELAKRARAAERAKARLWAQKRDARIRTRRFIWPSIGGTIAGILIVVPGVAVKSAPLILLGIAATVVFIFAWIGILLRFENLGMPAAQELNQINADADNWRRQQESAEHEIQRVAGECEQEKQRMFAERAQEFYRIHTEREISLRSAEARLQRAQEEFRNAISKQDDRFWQKRAALLQIKDTLDSLESQRSVEVRRLDEDLRQVQLEEHLQRCFIRHANIPGIPLSLIPQLASYGIETAYDVSPDAVRDVPGFGPVRTDKLVSWRQQKERAFRFDPSKGVPQARRQAVEMRFQQQRIQYGSLLRHGPSELRQITATAKADAENWRKEIARLHSILAQAKADLAQVHTQVNI